MSEYDWLVDEHETEATADCGCRMWRDGAMVKLKYCSVHEAVSKDATREMRAAIYEPGKPVAFRAIGTTLDAWQAIVGGYVRQAAIRARPGLYVMAYEDGHLMENMPFNRPGHIFGYDGDVFVGTIFVTRISADGTQEELSDEDVTWLRRNTP